jgi:hypothetical protein
MDALLLGDCLVMCIECCLFVTCARFVGRAVTL